MKTRSKKLTLNEVNLMSLFKFFHIAKTFEEDIQREKVCVARTKQAVSKKCGVHTFIDEVTIWAVGEWV